MRHLYSCALAALCVSSTLGAPRKQTRAADPPAPSFDEPSAADREQAPAGTAVDLPSEPALLHARGEKLAQ